MILLLDSCVWGGTLGILIDQGHDVIWSGDWTNDPGDAEILSIACQQKRILVTLDKDFGELAIVWGIPHCGIIRLVNLSIKQQAAVCSRILSLYSNELLEGAIVTAEVDRIRIRPSVKETMD
ncbi:MAG: DUF5615 family PIN-like protein [Candidatus Omnitrophota bacterium]